RDKTADAIFAGNPRRFGDATGWSQGRRVGSIKTLAGFANQVGIEMRTVGRKGQTPSWIKFLPGRDGIQSGHFLSGEIVRIHKDQRLRLALPDFFRNPFYEGEFALVEFRSAIRATADVIIRRFDEEPVGMRIKVDNHFADIFAHEPLRFLAGRTEIPTPAMNPKLIDRRAVAFFRLHYRMLNRIAIHAVITERRETEQDANVFLVSIIA